MKPAKGRPHDINLLADDHSPRGRRGAGSCWWADMDSTIINVECLDELADMAGLKPQIAAITERAMRGELDSRPPEGNASAC